jgi:hypothetical protein
LSKLARDGKSNANYGADARREFVKDVLRSVFKREQLEPRFVSRREDIAQNISQTNSKFVQEKLESVQKLNV